MLSGFEKIVEERIQAAMRKGDLNDLPGTGHPLQYADDRHIPEELRMAHHILKNADCLPPEIELKREILKTEDLLANMSDTAEKYRMIKKLNYMIIKLNTMRGSAITSEEPQRYMAKLAERFGTQRSSTE